MPDPTPTPSVPAPVLSRRVAVLGGCAAAAVCLAGCARYGDTDSATTPPEAGGPSPAAPSGDDGQPDAPAGIVAASEVPVGGGVVLADRSLVVTQPRAGTFAAFGTTCPHQGCSVNEVADGTINCPCHGSRFRLRDGGVAKGPAKRGLPARTVRDVDGRIQLA